MSELVVVEHTRGAGPSSFVEVLDGRRSLLPWRAVRAAEGEDLPDDLDGVGGIVVMGGTMSVTDADELPWMQAELAWLHRAVGSEVPVFGVCLGAQLLGRALGGEVARRDRPEVGYLPLTRTDPAVNDEVMGGWPDGAVSLFVHEDEVTALPPAASALLTGSDGVAAWRAGSAWAVQFHPEVDAAQLEHWLGMDSLTRLTDAAGTDPDALLEEARRRDRVTTAHGRALIGRFIDAAVRPRLG
jgi:GMP synthase (glutamine-hydrolysing)